MGKEDEEAKGSLHLAKSLLTFLTASHSRRERVLIVVFATKVKNASLESSEKLVFVL